MADKRIDVNNSQLDLTIIYDGNIVYTGQTFNGKEMASLPPWLFANYPPIDN